MSAALYCEWCSPDRPGCNVCEDRSDTTTEGLEMALVLSRKLGEKILIGSDIEIVVTDIDRGKIRLAITAPRDVPIFRSELLRERVDGTDDQADHSAA